MRLLAIILGIVLDQYLHIKPLPKRFHWLTPLWQFYQKRLPASLLQNGWSALAILVLPIVAIVGLVFFMLDDTIVGFVLSVVVLWYCLSFSEVGRSVRDDSSNPSDEDAIAIAKGLFWRSHESLFGLLFWFAVLGATGAFAYGLISATVELTQGDTNTHPLAQKVHAILAWIPARLTSLSYVLVGNFFPGFNHWFAGIRQFTGSQDMLIQCGGYAIDNTLDESAPHNRSGQAFAMIKRALILWILVMAVFTLGNLF